MPQNDSFMNDDGANFDMNINSDDNIPGTSHLSDPMKRMTMPAAKPIN